MASHLSAVPPAYKVGSSWPQRPSWSPSFVLVGNNSAQKLVYWYRITATIIATVESSKHQASSSWEVRWNLKSRMHPFLARKRTCLTPDSGQQPATYTHLPSHPFPIWERGRWERPPLLHTQHGQGWSKVNHHPLSHLAPPPLQLPASFSCTRIAWRGGHGLDCVLRLREERRSSVFHAK